MAFRLRIPRGRLLGGEADLNNAGRHNILLRVNEVQEICREVLKFSAMGRLTVWQIMYVKKYLIKK